MRGKANGNPGIRSKGYLKSIMEISAVDCRESQRHTLEVGGCLRRDAIGYGVTYPVMCSVLFQHNFGRNTALALYSRSALFELLL
jgi:hypothetical protein